MTTADSTSGPLSGIRVIDLTIWVQGPTCGALLADMGAEVIKVEKAGAGDFARNFAGMNGVIFRRADAPNLLWAACNRNKRSLALDLNRAAAAPVFRALLEGADVLVTNLHPEALELLGATEPMARAINPRLVYARGSGLGDSGPRSLDPCQDTVGMAYGGMMSTCRSPAGVPFYPPGTLNDVLAGTMLAFGVLAALHERTRTGEGQYVSSSQLQSALWLQSLCYAATANLGQSLKPFNPDEPSSALTNVYRCLDGRWIALGLLLDHQWAPLCRAIDRPELIRDDRFATLRARSRNAVELSQVLKSRFAEEPAETFLKALREAALWASPVNDMDDLVADPQVKANGYERKTDDGLRHIGMPFSLRGHEARTLPAPDLGADSDEILTELGLTEEERLALKVDGAVW